MPVGKAELKLAHEKKVRQLRLDHNAIADVEEISGKGIGVLFREQMSFSIRRLLLCVALRHERAGMQPQAAGVLIQQHCDAGGKLREIDEAIGRAVEDSGVLREITDLAEGEDETPAGDQDASPDPTLANG